MNFVSVRSTDLLSKYFGETENTIRNLFRKARSAAPCVLFFDDFDSLAHKRYRKYNVRCKCLMNCLFAEGLRIIA